MRNRQVIRQWRVLRLLEQRPRTLAELAAAVGERGGTTRTIRRDLEALEAAGFPLYNERHEDGAVRWHALQRVAPERRSA